jgi:Tfp pilus assembly protein PilO
MRGNDRTILLVIPMVAALVAFWFLLISPKQDEVKKLDQQIATLQSSVDQQKQAAQQGLEARKQFPKDYQRLVVMSKAVPVDDETASLMIQIQKIADSSGVSFRSITLSEGAGGSSTATAAPSVPTPSTSTAGTTTPAPATEAAASLLPIGATVGSANLPVLPYSLIFRGTYFEVADFMAGIDKLVETGKGKIAADGRLVTIDDFNYTADETAPYPVLKASLNVTTYVTPRDQGVTAGATPTGPSTAAPITPASATTATTP